MKQTKETLKFFSDIEKTVKGGDDITDFVKADVELFETTVRDGVLRKRVHLDESWSMYQLSDVNIYFDDDVLKTYDRLELYGIRQFAPSLRGNDVAATMMYRFTAFDMLGGALGIATGFHIIVKRSSGAVEHRRVFVYG